MRTHIPQLVFAVGVSLASACGESSTAPQADPTGTYSLTTINGKAPPGIVSQTSQQTLEVRSLSVTLTSDRRFSFTGTFRTTIIEGIFDATQSGVGTWTLRGHIVDMTLDDPTIMPPTAMTWDGGNTLTANDRTGTVPVTMVFKR